jgi:hypothetical protein
LTTVSTTSPITSQMPMFLSMLFKRRSSPRVEGPPAARKTNRQRRVRAESRKRA